jgi:hypothetical protein
MDDEHTKSTDHEEDNTMTEMDAANDLGQQDEESDFSPLTSLENTPTAIRRRSMNMFNEPTSRGSMIGRRYHQDVGMPQTLNISPSGLFTGRGGTRANQNVRSQMRS